MMDIDFKYILRSVCFVVELALLLTVLLIMITVVANDPFGFQAHFTSYLSSLYADGFTGFLSVMIFIGIYASMKISTKR